VQTAQDVTGHPADPAPAVRAHAGVWLGLGTFIVPPAPARRLALKLYLPPLSAAPAQGA